MNQVTTVMADKNLSGNLYIKARTPEDQIKSNANQHKTCKHRTSEGFCTRSNRQCPATIM